MSRASLGAVSWFVLIETHALAFLRWFVVARWRNRYSLQWPIAFDQFWDLERNLRYQYPMKVGIDPRCLTRRDLQRLAQSGKKKTLGKAMNGVRFVGLMVTRLLSVLMGLVALLA